MHVNWSRCEWNATLGFYYVNLIQEKEEGGRGKKAPQQIAVDLFSSFILGYPEWKGAQWTLDIIAREFNMISAARKTGLDKKIHILMIGK